MHDEGSSLHQEVRTPANYAVRAHEYWVVKASDGCVLYGTAGNCGKLASKVGLPNGLDVENDLGGKLASKLGVPNRSVFVTNRSVLSCRWD